MKYCRHHGGSIEDNIEWYAYTGGRTGQTSGSLVEGNRGLEWSFGRGGRLARLANTLSRVEVLGPAPITTIEVGHLVLKIGLYETKSGRQIIL
jgi:hypothetical protein